MPKKLSILLSGGVDNRTSDEFTAPVPTSGSAPKLKRSVNTSLAVVPGAISRSPACTAIASTEATVLRGMVSAANGRSTLLLPGLDVRAKARAIVDAGRDAFATFASVRTPADNHVPMQSRILPARVVRSTAACVGKAVSQLASLVDFNGVILTAWWAHDGVPSSSSEYRLYAALTTAAGLPVVPATVIYSQTTLPNNWVAATQGTGYAAVWFVSGSGDVNFINIGTSTAASGERSITASSPVYVATVGNVSYGLAVCNGLSFLECYLAASVSGSQATGRLRLVDMNTGFVTWSTDFSNAMLGGGSAAVAFGPFSGANRIAVGFTSLTNANATISVRNGTTAVSTKTPAAIGGGRIALEFSRNNGAGAFNPLVSVVLENKRALGAISVVGVDHYTLDYGADLLSSVAFLPWYRVASGSVKWVTSNDFAHAIHQLVPRFDDANEQPGQAMYVDDPSLDLYVCRSNDASAANQSLTLLTRLGVVRGTSAPADHLYTGQVAGQSAVMVGSQLHCFYRLLDDYGGASDGAARVRRTVIELGDVATQMPAAYDRDGSALLAGALPLLWDGVAVTELGGPSHTPRLLVEKVTTGGTVLPAGTYSYQAVLYWTGADGLVRRTRPSKIQTVTLNGTTEMVRVHMARPLWLGAEAVEARIYSTEANGKGLYLMARAPVTTLANYTTYATVVTTANAQIYSSGGAKEEVTPQPPPPLRDVSIVGQRAWGVDAELSSRAVYTKLRVAGVGYEWNPAYEVILPSGAGDLMAVREWQGLPLFLTERGLFQVSGDGPSNTLNGTGSFSAPVKVSDIGCTNAASIVAYPGGILWQSGARFAVLDGEGVRYLPDFACLHDVSAGSYARRYGEVLLFSAAQQEVRVFHPESSRWTTWDAGTLPSLVQAAHVLPWDPDALLLMDSAAGSQLRRMDVATSSSAPNLVLETDWMLLGGDFQDEINLQALVFNGRAVGAHSLQIDLFSEYSSTAFTSAVFSSAEIAGFANAGGFYSVKVEPTAKTVRALKVRITETLVASPGCSPRALTLLYDVVSLLREDAFPAGAFK